MDLAKLQEALKGRKTYIMMALAVLVTILEGEGVIDGIAAEKYMEFIMYGGGATLVAKFNRLGGGNG